MRDGRLTPLCVIDVCVNDSRTVACPCACGARERVRDPTKHAG